MVSGFTPKRPRVEMIPLIDMFFLLLVFFIYGVFSMAMQQGILVDLPQASTATSTQEEAVTVSLTAEGAVFLNQEPVALDALAAALQAVRLRVLPRTEDRARHEVSGVEGRRPDPLVIINADRRSPHGTVMTVLDAVRQAGLQRISLQAATP